MRFLKFLMSLSILILEKLMNILWTDSNSLMQFLNLSVDRPIKEKHLFCLVSNHQFNWWFALSPNKGFLTARPKGRCRKHSYWSAKKQYFLHLLFVILLPAR